MSVQKQNHPSIKVAIPGVSGVGKSTLFEKLIRRENAKWIFIFDHKDGDLSRRFKAKPCYTVEELEAATARGGFVVFNPGRMYPGEPERGFAFFCEWLFPICKILPGKKIIASDELDNLLDEHRPLCVILDQGRTFQMDCFFICQSMNGLHNQVRKQFTEIFAFRQGDANGVIWLKGKGFVEDEVLNLKNGEWIYKNLNTGAMQKGGSSFEPKNSRRNLAGL